MRCRAMLRTLGRRHEAGHSRHDHVRRRAGAEGPGPQPHVLLVQQRRQSRRVPRRRGRLLPKIRPHRRAVRSGEEPQRAQDDRGRRQRLLPGEARRHLRSQRAGHWRAADRHDRRRVQGQARRRREMTMARIIGGIATTHVPAIGKAIAENKYQDPYWKPFFSGFDYVHRWLAREKPDVAVVFYNDHGLNFFLDKLPTFAVGAAHEYRNEDEGWGIPVSRAVAGIPDLSWHLINALVADEFDVTMCQEMLVDHAVTIPLALMWPGATAPGESWPIRIVPVAINTVQHPLPSLGRCLYLGRSIGRALETFPRDLRVMVIGTGGLSHQLDGERAGFINKEFDRLCMDTLAGAPEELIGYSIPRFVELAGAQGVEFLNWMAMRGALTGRVSELHR